MADTTFRLVLTLSVNENQAEQLRQAGYGEEAQNPAWYAGYAEGAGEFLLPGVTVAAAQVASDDDTADLAKLRALEAFGVDNWEGYGDAVRSLHE